MGGGWDMASRATKPRQKKTKTITTTMLSQETAATMEEVLRRKVIKVERYGRPLAYLVEATTFEEMRGGAGT